MAVDAGDAEAVLNRFAQAGVDIHALAGRKTELWLTPAMSRDLEAFEQTGLERRLQRGGLPPFLLARTLPERDFQLTATEYVSEALGFVRISVQRTGGHVTVAQASATLSCFSGRRPSMPIFCNWLKGMGHLRAWWQGSVAYAAQ